MLGSLEEERVLESENTDALVKKSRLIEKSSELPHTFMESPFMKTFKPY